MTLNEFFKSHKNVAIAFSGGVDSAYLLYTAVQYAERVTAYYVRSAFQPQFEYDDAVRLAENLGAELKVIPVDILSEEKVRENPKDRCYYCKKCILTAIIKNAAKDGYDTLLDGTNASDEVSDRPGMRALKELHILSPLRECGLTKNEIRRLSREAGLFIWDKPAYACLATRIPTGRAIDERMLCRTEKAEDYLKTLGLSDFRVRTEGEIAKLQVREEDIPLVINNREEILERLLQDYSGVMLDLQTR